MGRTTTEHRSAGFDNELFQSMDCVVVELDPMGNIVRMNPVAEAFFGQDMERFSGKPFVGGLVPEISSTGKNQGVGFDEFLKHPGEAGNLELEVRNSGGAMVGITWATTIYIGPNGHTEKIICTGIDRRACLEKERDFNRRFDILESFLEASMACAMEVNSEHRFSYLSPGVEKIIGYLPEELIGRTPDMFFDPKEKSQITELIEGEIRKGARNHHMVNQTRHKNGALIWHEVNQNLFYDEKGAFSGLISLNRNIDEQKKAELALLDREKEFRFCLEHAQVMLVVTDGQGVIRSINRVGARMYGRESEEMIGHVFTEFLPDFERERVLQMFKKDFRAAMAKRDGSTVGMGGLINKIKTPDGLKDVLFYKAGVKVYKDGKFEGILNTAVDITEIVKAREALKRHRHQLEQLVAERTVELQGLQEEIVRRERLTALGKMANVISQEIRTPLSTISNSFFVINERLKNEELGVKRSLERANRAIQRCYSIVDEFKIFTQTDEFKKEATDVDPWLNRLLDHLPNEMGGRVIKELDAGVTIEIDRDRVQRAVVNVLENAWQAGSDDRIVVKSKLAFNRLEIEVEDAGVGILRNDLERVFEPLFSTKSFGLGLGLSVSRQIMEQHGGGISIESKEKKGTIVLLWLPVENVSSSAASGNKPR